MTSARMAGFVLIRRGCGLIRSHVVLGALYCGHTSLRQLHLSARYKMAAASIISKNPLVGVVQMTATPDKEANYETSRSLIESAAQRGAKVVFLPEAFDIIGENREQSMAAAEPLSGPTISRYAALAKQHDVWLSLGGFHEKPAEGADSRVYNTHLILDSNGEIKGTYRKTHLFNVDIKGGVRLQESEYTRPGQAIGPPVATPAGNVGMAICYDMRFPELSLALTQQGADILTYPSAFTVPTGMAHWETLLRARAIENQCYVIAAAQVGKHTSKRSSYGHAMIVDPWGCVVAECSDKVGVIVAEIDHSYIKKRRIEMPVWTHRRHDLYGHLLVQPKSHLDSQPTYQFGQVTLQSSQLFYRTALSYAFVNRKPVLPGHVLLAPLRCAERYSDLTPAEAADLFTTAQTVAKVIEKQHNASSSTIAIQDGVDAGQSVKHVHVHILPRKPGDFDNNDDIYDKLEKHDKDVSAGKWRTDEDMAKEASELRLCFI